MNLCGGGLLCSFALDGAPCENKPGYSSPPLMVDSLVFFANMIQHQFCEKFFPHTYLFNLKYIIIKHL